MSWDQDKPSNWGGGGVRGTVMGGTKLERGPSVAHLTIHDHAPPRTIQLLIFTLDRAKAACLSWAVCLHL